jgi:hypothetical protein
VLYGTLKQEGALVGAVPGSDRRFAGFDAVYSLDPSGFSDYWGLSVGLERDVSRGLSVMTSYTFSQTTDNWFGARGDGPDAQLLPFADSGATGSWSRGRSDFDVPHRLVVGAEVRLGGRIAPRLAVLYRYQSGYPFTPGFRDGVDANGDGSARNDPAFVTDTLPGAADIIAAQSCLRAQIGRFADRNSCRDPAVSSLDFRLAFTLVRTGRTTTELLVDVFGAVRTGTDLIDHALYLVDRSAQLQTSTATGVTTVPLVANPNFGHALARRDPGATVRVGVRVGF